MRLLHLTHSLNPACGGTSEALRQIVLAGAGLDTPVTQEVLVLDPPQSAWLANFPAPVHALGHKGWLARRPAVRAYGWTPLLEPWLQQFGRKFDAWVVHGLWQYPGLAAWRQASRLGLPYFVVPHGMLDPWFKRQYPLKHAKKWLYWPWAEYRVLRDAQAVLYTHEQEAADAANSFWLYRAKVAVAGLGMALDPQAQQASVQSFLDQYPALRGMRLLLFMGRLHEKKGCDMLVRAFAAVAEQDERLRLVMAGPAEPAYLKQLQGIAAELGIADKLLWPGMLHGPMKWAALRAAQVFVLPSHQENFGLGVVEALAVGTPVIVSKCVNTWREIVADGAGWAGPDTQEGTAEQLRLWLQLSAAQQSQAASQALACYARRCQAEAALRRWFEVLFSHS